ncbi:MAG: UDP-N-acetylmuramoyl-tripeptide--D-alanyl-D-alanine ligase [Deltaproteobacteria bacterium]|nr:UDP-N-acetylmuramoyl-tripeptide--D-alanyl-D-alanine ligase [Deltaproteobacteria bacterium]
MNAQLHPSLSVREVLDATGGTLIRGEAQRIFLGVSTDTRTVASGNLFIPLKGERFDGHDFLEAAISAGAGGVLVQAEAAAGLSLERKDVTIVAVADTLQALGALAHSWRMRFDIPVAAVTGSSGKTTTKEMAAAILGLRKSVLVTKGNLNNQVGLPLTLFGLDEDHEAVVVEMGTNLRGEIERLTRIAYPDVGLVTNVGPAHLEGLFSLDIVREEKGDLFRFMKPTGVAIINLDDDATRILGGRWEGRRITFGLGRGADVTASNVQKMGSEGIRFDLEIGGRSVNVRIGAPGEHNLQNALAAAALARAMDIDLSQIQEGLEKHKAPPGRMEIHRLARGVFVIDDTYNANPLSVREAVKTLRFLKEGHRSMVILGDMLELGGQARRLHEEIGILLAESGTDALFLKGNHSLEVAAGARRGGMPQECIHIFETSGQIMPFIADRLGRGDWILVKGSRKMKMEEIVDDILEALP